MINLSDLGFIYPDLVYDIWDYYADKTKKTTSELDLSQFGIHTDIITIKSAFDFFITFRKKYEYDILNENLDFSYKIIAKISDKLWEHGFILKYDIGIPNLDGGYNYYMGYKETGKNKEMLSCFSDKKTISYILNSTVYGFKYIYKYNKFNVIPFDNEDGKDGFLLTKSGYVLDEIMVMGYPSHCGFNNFVTATRGSIAAIEKSFLAKYELMLLTSVCPQSLLLCVQTLHFLA